MKKLSSKEKQKAQWEGRGVIMREDFVKRKYVYLFMERNG